MTRYRPEWDSFDEFDPDPSHRPSTDEEWRFAREAYGVGRGLPPAESREAMTKHEASKLVGAKVQAVAVELAEYGDDNPIGIVVLFEDGRKLRVFSPFECPEEIDISVQEGQ